jgi:UDP-2,3-diacylglucosamine hydrolase
MKQGGEARHSLFISDLHLAAERPRIQEQFFELLRSRAREAEALYVLGDLFEYWAGDDDLDDALNRSVAAAFETLSASGTRVYFMHGNRDFLVGRDFGLRAGATLLEDPALTDLYGTPSLLMHGDTLCTDDLEYQKFRLYARDAENQARFLAQPVTARRAEMAQLRARSEAAKQTKTAEIMDVNSGAVEEAIRNADYPPRLIHGHTHRPAHHVHIVDGRRCERWVLADWYENGSYLKVDASGCKSIALN